MHVPCVRATCFTVAMLLLVLSMGGSAAPKPRGGLPPDAALSGGQPAGAGHSERRRLELAALWQPAVEPAGSQRAELLPRV